MEKLTVTFGMNFSLKKSGQFKIKNRLQKNEDGFIIKNNY